MNLSTPRFKYLKGLTAAITIPVIALAACHGGLEVLARWAESKPAYYLWRSEDQLLLLSPARFQHSGKGRVMIFGASESAEGFVDKVIEQRLPGSQVENMAFDGAMFKDILLQLQYMEKVYGADAIPSDIVIGLSVRFLANFQIPRTRLFRDAVNKYSPIQVVTTPSGSRVVAKSRFRAAVSWFRFRLHQTERYRYAVHTAGVELAYKFAPKWAARNNLRNSLAKAKYWSRVKGTDDEIRGRLKGISHWQQSRVWKASEHLDLVEPEMNAVIEFAHRHHARLYFVNMPMLGVTKSIFVPGVIEDYIQTVNATRGDALFLDLGDLLTPDEFSDAVHATGKGAIHISSATANFLRQKESSPQAFK